MGSEHTEVFIKLKEPFQQYDTTEMCVVMGGDVTTLCSFMVFIREGTHGTTG